MKAKKLISALLAITVLASAAAMSGCGGDDPSSQAAAGGEKKDTIIVGLDDQFPPMGYRDDDGNLVGFDIDIATETFERMGMEVKLQPIDWKVKEQELNAETVDCLWNGYTITDARKEEVLFSDAYMKNRQIIVVMADSDINSMDDLKGQKLALQSESSASDALDSVPDFKNSLGEVLLFDDNNKALMDLESGGASGVLIDEVVARYYTKKDPSKYRILDESLADEEYGVGFRKSDEELRNKVNETFKEMKEDGTLAEISEKWFGEDITTIE